MAEVLQSNAPEADPKKANVFFDRGKTIADTGNFEYAIEMYLQGLSINPDSKDAHQQLRDISLKRKASGGKDLGMMEKMKLKRSGKDDKASMLNAEKLMAYDPGNTDNMVNVLQSAHKAGLYDTVMWVGPILLQANLTAKSPEVKKLIILKDVYKDLGQWKAATEACHHALRLNPDNGELQTELKNLSAQDTMTEGNYAAGGNFRASMRDKESQDDLIQQGRDVRSADMVTRQIMEAEAAYKADPVEGRLLRLVEFLEKTEDPDHENHALELLEKAYKETKQFRFRQRVGKIKISQMQRMERTLRQAVQANPKDEKLKHEYDQLKKMQTEFELEEFTLWADSYPTDLTIKYAMAERLFALKRYDEAIPIFQFARVDPKLKNRATITLGRAFLEAGYVDEAIETIQGVIDEYQLKGDDLSKQMYYWQGRAQEQKGANDLAIKRYSQVAQWEFTYRDVQTRIKQLRK